MPAPAQSTPYTNTLTHTHHAHTVRAHSWDGLRLEFCGWRGKGARGARVWYTFAAMLCFKQYARNMRSDARLRAFSCVKHTFDRTQSTLSLQHMMCSWQSWQHIAAMLHICHRLVAAQSHSHTNTTHANKFQFITCDGKINPLREIVLSRSWRALS